MITNKEEQLNRYFEHLMSAKEEQNFLISVAASDEMRIAFRSQLELMKAVREDKDTLRVGANGHPVAQVRNRTLTALGLSATAVTPFIEHELTRARDNSSATSTQAMKAEPTLSVTAEAPVAAEMGIDQGWFSHVVSFFRRPTLALTAGLALGIVSSTAIMRLTAPESALQRSVEPAAAVSPSPTAVKAKTVHARPAEHRSASETIPASNGLNNSSREVGIASRHAGQRATAEAHPTNANPELKQGAAVSKGTPATSIPEVTLSGAATMHSNKPTITTVNDSTQAK